MLSIDFNAYLNKLGIHDQEPLATDLNSLRRLQLAHLVALPFQSLSTILQQPIALDAGSLYQKLVVDGRGGHGYELNLLFWHLLQHLGFHAEAITAAMVHHNQPDIPHARTHMLLQVLIDSEPYIVDVGLGGQVPSAPLHLNQLEPQTTPHGRYRVQPYQQRHLLSINNGDDWQMLYDFELAAQNLVDLEVGNWYVSTHPLSPLRQNLMAARCEANGTRHTLFNRCYHIHRPNGMNETHWLHNADEVLTILQQGFKINPPADNNTHKELQTFLSALPEPTAMQ